MTSSLEALRAVIRADGGALGATVDDGPAREGDPDHAARAAAGPRVAEYRAEAELAIAAVREGYELHYGRSRALRIEDPDLALLAGDRLYALGLARLAGAGDLGAIAELADVISLSAQAHTGGDVALAEAAWDAGMRAIGWGRTAAAE